MLIYRLVLITLGVVGGSFLLYFLKRIFVDARTTFSFDIDGILERAAIILLFLGPPLLLFIIPAVVIAKITYYFLSYGHFKRFAEIAKREGPPLAYQRIKLKSVLALDLIGSPLLAILIGIALKGPQ